MMAKATEQDHTTLKVIVDLSFSFPFEVISGMMDFEHNELNCL